MSLAYHSIIPEKLVASCLQLSYLPFSFSRSYGMRFIAKVLKDSLHEKFPDAGEDELLKVRI